MVGKYDPRWKPIECPNGDIHVIPIDTFHRHELKDLCRCKPHIIDEDENPFVMMNVVSYPIVYVHKDTLSS